MERISGTCLIKTCHTKGSGFWYPTQCLEMGLEYSIGHFCITLANCLPFFVTQVCATFIAFSGWSYTLLQKKLKFSKVAFLLEKIVCQWTLDHTSLLGCSWKQMGSFASYSEEYEAKSFRPYAKASDPGAPAKKDRLNLSFFWRRV